MSQELLHHEMSLGLATILTTHIPTRQLFETLVENPEKRELQWLLHIQTWCVRHLKQSTVNYFSVLYFFRHYFLHTNFLQYIVTVCFQIP